MDEFSEELEHLEFMEHLHNLQEQIFLAYANVPPARLLPSLWDIDTLGNEPIFASMLFKRILAESGENVDNW